MKYVLTVVSSLWLLCTVSLQALAGEPGGLRTAPISGIVCKTARAAEDILDKTKFVSLKSGRIEFLYYRYYQKDVDGKPICELDLVLAETIRERLVYRNLNFDGWRVAAYIVEVTPFGKKNKLYVILFLSQRREEATLGIPEGRRFLTFKHLDFCTK